MPELVPLERVRGRALRLEEYLEKIKEILSSWSAPALAIDGEGNVLEGAEHYNALVAIGTKYVPVARGPSEAGTRVPLDLLEPFHELSRPNPRAYWSVLELVDRDGPTPLVKLKGLGRGRATAWAKLEWYHPFSLSIKDRVAWNMLRELALSGKPPRAIYEATSTNTGLGVVGIANYLGARSRVYLPSTAQRCVDYIFAAMGAEVVRAEEGITVKLLERVLEDARREGALVPNQFENDANFVAHLRGTAKEVDYQLSSAGRRPSAIVCALGTSGHLSAMAAYFKWRYGSVKAYGVQPRAGESIPGMRRAETGCRWLKMVEVDGLVDVSLEEAFEGVLKVARGDGILVGLSSGAVAYAFERLVEEGSIEGDAVLVFPDHGIKYVELLAGLVSRACPEETYF